MLLFYKENHETITIIIIINIHILIPGGKGDDSLVGAPLPNDCLDALPSSTVRTRLAKFKEQKVSSAEAKIGLAQTIINVLLSCDKES